MTAAVVLAGCTSDPKVKEDIEPAGVATIGADRRVEVASLGLTFTLPESFSVEKDPDLTFLASSDELPAILSVAGEEPSVIEHDAEGGERLKRVSIDGAEALIVTNAEVGELPRGIIANEVLVSNGQQSFSLIFSARAQTLAEAWEPFVASLSIG